MLERILMGLCCGVLLQQSGSSLEELAGMAGNTQALPEINA